MDIFGLLLTVVFIAAVVVGVMYVIDWMKLASPWDWIVRAIAGIFLIAILFGLVTGGIQVPHLTVFK